MKIRPVGAELFSAERRTDRYGEANSRTSQFAKTPEHTGQFLSQDTNPAPAEYTAGSPSTPPQHPGGVLKTQLCS